MKDRMKGRIASNRVAYVSQDCVGVLYELSSLGYKEKIFRIEYSLEISFQ